MAARHILGRQAWVIVHRWAGLTLALFLAVAGLTGMALAWQDALEDWAAPALMHAAPPAPGAPMRDPVALRTAALARHPGMVADFLPLTVKPGHALEIRVGWQMADGRSAPDWDDLFIDPYTGRELGHRHWGDLSGGWINLMPVIYRLHESLLLGSWGELSMGLAALVWTLDCFVGFWLTLPLRRQPQPGLAAPVSKDATFWHRWRPAWRIRRKARGHKLTFDLHRAGGLWVWPLLLVFAWSSVSFNLAPIYNPVMAAFGAQDQRAAMLGPPQPQPRTAPRLDFAAAQAQGIALARRQATAHGAAIPATGTTWLWHIPSTGTYVYGFTTAADIADAGGGSEVAFDSDSGALRHVALAGTTPAANRITDWLVALHMAAVFGWPWRVMVTLLGAMVTMLSVTGILIWTKKRSARLMHRRRIGRVAAVPGGVAASGG